MIYAFEDCELDTGRFELRRAGAAVPLEPQVFDVLAYLVRHHDRFVPKDELIEHVWPERYISESALNNRLMTARRAIGDSGREQRLIRTVHGRGYRFLGAVWQQGAGMLAARPVLHEPAGVPPLGAARPAVHQAAPPAAVPEIGAVAAGIVDEPALSYGVVGRELELAALSAALATALAGRRRVLFITGEAGAGKTTLMSAFLERARAVSGLRIAQGQCLEHRGAGEAYLPVFEGIGRVCRGPEGAEVVALLHRRAPNWLIHMPWLIEQEALTELQQRTLGTTRERMLREMGEALESMAQARPLLLLLEDLHWSDYSTLDLIDWLARRQEPAQLLIVATYRPAEVRGTGHPLDTLKHNLRIRALCEELPLPMLTEAMVEQCLAARFPGRSLPPGLAGLVHRRTDGNPLFICNLIDDWLVQGLLLDTGDRLLPATSLDELATLVPASMRELVEQQFDRLGAEEQVVLEAASVIGPEFATAALDAATGRSLEAVEERCSALARRGLFLVEAGTREWPNGAVTARHRFTHGLYQEVIYRRIPPARKARLHQQVATRLEACYAVEAGEHAAELALHFACGRDAERAVRYLRLAADAAVQMGAYREAIQHLSTALPIVESRADLPDRSALQMALHAGLGSALMATEGFGSEAAVRSLSRAVEVAEAHVSGAHLAYVVYGLAALHQYRGDDDAAAALLGRVDPLHLGGDPAVLLPYHALSSCSLLHQGRFAESVDHGRRGLSIADPRPFDPRYAFMGEDAGNGCREWSALALWFLGYPDQALASVRQALDVARAPARRYALASAQTYCARVHHLRREPAAAAEHAAATITLARDQGFGYHIAVGMILAGWARALLGDGAQGLAQLREGLAAHLATGAVLDRPYYVSLLVEACEAAGLHAEALRTLEETLAGLPRGRPFFYEAELHRQRGALLLDSADGQDHAAERCFRDALAIARRQGARSLELRAVVSLCRLLLKRGDREAGTLLAPITAWFTEGHDTADLREATALLDEIAATM